MAAMGTPGLAMGILTAFVQGIPNTCEPWASDWVEDASDPPFHCFDTGPEDITGHCLALFSDPCMVAEESFAIQCRYGRTLPRLISVVALNNS